MALKIGKWKIPAHKRTKTRQEKIATMATDKAAANRKAMTAAKKAMKKNAAVAKAGAVKPKSKTKAKASSAPKTSSRPAARATNTDAGPKTRGGVAKNRAAVGKSSGPKTRGGPAKNKGSKYQSPSLKNKGISVTDSRMGKNISNWFKSKVKANSPASRRASASRKRSRTGRD